VVCLTSRAFAGTLARQLEQFRAVLSGREHVDVTLLTLLTALEQEAWPQILQQAVHWLNIWRAPDMSSDDPNKVAKVATLVLNKLWTATREEELFSQALHQSLASDLLRATVRPLLDFIESWLVFVLFEWV
jgi:hypothetical protein